MRTHTITSPSRAVHVGIVAVRGRLEVHNAASPASARRVVVKALALGTHSGALCRALSQGLMLLIKAPVAAVVGTVLTLLLGVTGGRGLGWARSRR